LITTNPVVFLFYMILDRLREIKRIIVDNEPAVLLFINSLTDNSFN
jgi:hypothetical protein